MDQERLPSLQRGFKLLATGLIYFICASAAILWARFDGGFSLVWVANASLIARLSLTPISRWGAQFAVCGLAFCVAIWIFSLKIIVALPFMGINLAECAITVWLLRRWLGDSRYFESINGIASFVIIAGGLAPIVTASAAAGLMTIDPRIPYATNWLDWFAGHALGAITFTPIFLLILRGELTALPRRIDLRGAAGGGAVMAVLAAVILLVFSQRTAPLLFLPMLPLVIATLKFGRRGAAAGTVVLAVLGGILTLRGSGPVYLMHVSTGERVQFFQFYVAVSALIVLPLAALLNQRKDLMRKLAQSEAVFRLLAENSSDAILHLAVDGTILYASPAVRDLAGFDPDDLVGRNARELVIEDDLPMVVAAHARALAESSASFVVAYRVKTDDGRLVWFETTTRAIPGVDGAPVGAVSAVRDISSRKAIEFKLAEAANTDPLTGLFNRRAFLENLELRIAEIDRGEGSCAVAMFDLDRFKSVNDTYGHAAGDLVLEHFARIARRTLRQADVIGRIGGEEFAILLCNSDQDVAMRVSERLRAAMSNASIDLDGGQRLTVTASAGFAMVARGQNAADVLGRADEALYQAKAAGRDCLRLAA